MVMNNPTIRLEAVEIQGEREVLRNFQRIADVKSRKKAMLRAMRKSMRPVLISARNAAKLFDDKTTTNRQIWKQIAISAGRHRNGYFTMRVGVRGGALNRYVNNARNRRARRAGQTYKTDGRVFYWRYRELGRRGQRKDPFLVPALYRNRNQVATILGNELRAELAKLTNN